MEKIASGSTHQGSFGGQHNGDHIKGHTTTGTTGIESDASVIADKSSALAIDSTADSSTADKK